MLLLTRQCACSIFVGFIAARVAAGFDAIPPQDIHQGGELFQYRFDKFQLPRCYASTNDITQIQLVLVMMLRILFYAPIMV